MFSRKKSVPVLRLLSSSEIDALKNTSGGLEWDGVVENIRRAHGGKLPPNWNDAVIASGIRLAKMSEWNDPTNSYTYSEWGMEPTL